jgi:hypothetical protein
LKSRTVLKTARRFRGLIIVFSGGFLENSEASRTKLKRVIPVQNGVVSNIHGSFSSSSDAANPPAKKGKRL